MKNIFIVTCFIAHFFTAGGQDREDYIPYQEQIMRIEEQVAGAHFDAASAMYYELFRKYDRVLAKDAYNACQVAALAGHRYFPDFFFICARSGITKTKLLVNPLIYAGYAPDSLRWNDYYDAGAAFYRQRIDPILRREMMERYEKEQKHKGSKEYPAICADNFNRIVELCKEGRFPGEDLIGNSDDMESLIFPTLLHYPYSYLTMRPYLLDALRDGKVTPFSLVYLYSFNQTRTSVLYTEDIPIDKAHFNSVYNIPFGATSHDITAVDRERKSRYILSTAVEEQLKKVCEQYGLDYQWGYY